MTHPQHIVVDLDGTLAKVNTFRRWTVEAFLKRNATNAATYLASLLIFFGLYTLRVLRAFDHDTMKRLFIIFWGLRLQKLGNRVGTAFNARYAKRIADRCLNPAVMVQIKRLQSSSVNGTRTLLATAAPAFYASLIAEQLGFECLASQVEDEQLARDPFCAWSPNALEGKHEKVLELLGQGADYVVFTDHVDDWPLIEMAKAVYLVNPAPSLLEQTRALGKEMSILAG